MQLFTFQDGHQIPSVGFGTAAIGNWQQDDGYVKDVILKAIDVGYRHFDTASLYGNERSLGKALLESGIRREQFFVVSKVWDNQQGTQGTKKALGESLERLQMDYLDLYLIHWPYPEKTQATWQAMESAHAQGNIKSLGLSNFRISDVQDLLSYALVRPQYNQLELHPYLIQKQLVDYCNQEQILVSCWSPLGSGTWSGVDVSEKPISDPVVQAIAEKYGVSAGQVILTWDVQQGRIVIPKAESLKNIKANFELDGFRLTHEEIAAIDALDKGHRFGADPDTAHANNMAMTVPG